MNEKSEIFVEKIEGIGIPEIQQTANPQRKEKNCRTEKKLGNAEEVDFRKLREFKFL